MDVLIIRQFRFIVSKYFKIPIFFHSLKNYDAHLVISNLDILNNKKEDVSVIAQNSEKFINFCLKPA